MEWRCDEERRGGAAEQAVHDCFPAAVQTGISKPTKKSLQGDLNRHFSQDQPAVCTCLPCSIPRGLVDRSRARSPVGHKDTQEGLPGMIGT